MHNREFDSFELFALFESDLVQFASACAYLLVFGQLENCLHDGQVCGELLATTFTLRLLCRVRSFHFDMTYGTRLFRDTFGVGYEVSEEEMQLMRMT